MKQIEVYMSLADYFNSIKIKDHAVPNVAQIGDVGDGLYLYDHVILTPETNPALWDIVSSAGWNYTFPNAMTKEEFAMLTNKDIADNIGGSSSLTSFNEFMYCTGISVITPDMFSGCTSLSEITVPETVVKMINTSFDTCASGIQVHYIGSKPNILDGNEVGFMKVSYSTYESRNMTSVRMFIIPEESGFENKIEFMYISDASDNVKESLSGHSLGEVFSATTGTNVMYFSKYVSGASFEIMVCFSSNDIVIPVDFFNRGWAEPSNGVIKSISFPDNVIGLDKGSCFYLPSLTSLTLSDNIRTIGDSGISRCGVLSITMPSKLETIGANAFQECTGLTEIVLGNNIEEIGSGAFAGCYFQNITLGNNLETIGSGAFSGCQYLTSITIPSSVVSIGSSAFSQCHFVIGNFVNNSQLDEISNNYWGGKIYDSEQAGGLLISGNTAAYCRKNATDITVPNNVTFISASCCNYCYKLQHVALPNSVTGIGQSAFYYCSALTEVEMSDNVVSIGKYAFQNCKSLTSITIPSTFNGVIYEWTFYDCKSLKSIYFNAPVRVVSAYSFSHCESLESISLPAVTRIEQCAFSGCTSLSSVTIGQNLTRLGDTAFYDCHSLTGISIPNSVTAIGSYCFNYCTALTSVNLPVNEQYSAVTSYCFGYCTSLPGIVIPDNVKTINTGAFMQCQAISSVTIGNGLQRINDQAFFSCKSISSLTIPNSVTYIGDFALETTYYIASGVCPSYNRIYYPNENCAYSIVAAYSASTSAYTIREGTLSVSPHCFNPRGNRNESNTKLKSVTFPSTVLYIGSYAFQSCSNLTSLELSNSLSGIAGSCFLNCNNITSLTIGNSIKSISSYTFYGMSKLSAITIPASVTSMTDYAVYCTSIKEITCLATTAPSIGSNTFYQVGNGGVLKYPSGSNYSNWLKTSSKYLGYYGWTGQEI